MCICSAAGATHVASEGADVDESPVGGFSPGVSLADPEESGLAAIRSRGGRGRTARSLGSASHRGDAAVA
jgi:hypothetical protein